MNPELTKHGVQKWNSEMSNLVPWTLAVTAADPAPNPLSPVVPAPPGSKAGIPSETLVRENRRWYPGHIQQLPNCGRCSRISGYLVTAHKPRLA